MRCLPCIPLKMLRVTVITIVLLCSAVVLLTTRYFSPLLNHLLPHSNGLLAERRGFIVTSAFSGQLGSGIRAIVSVQCWIGSILSGKYNDLTLYLLEPMQVHSATFVSGTKLVDGRVTFKELFDIKYFNKKSVEMGFGQMVTLEDFIQNAPRKVTVLSLIVDVSTTKVFWTAQNDSDCYKGKELLALFDESFCITELIHSPASRRTKQVETNYIFTNHSDNVLYERWDPRQSVLLITRWMADWFAPVDTVPTNTPLSEHPRDSSRCKYSDLENIREHLIPSPSLLRDASLFKERFLTTNDHTKTVAAMFRMEHLVINGSVCHWAVVPSVKTCVQHCLLQAHNVTKSLQKQDSFSSNAFVTHDTGKYGSNTLMRSVHKSKLNYEFFKGYMNVAVQQLFKQNWTLGDLDDSYSQFSKNPGYIAALQKNIASDADCLVLVGGGNFHDMTLHDYIRKHPSIKDRCIRLVCCHKEGILQNVSIS